MVSGELKMGIFVHCPLCGKSAQSQGTAVISKVGRYAKTIQYRFRCSDPRCVDAKGNPPSWKEVKEFIGWVGIDYDPLDSLLTE